MSFVSQSGAKTVLILLSQDRATWLLSEFHFMEELKKQTLTIGIIIGNSFLIYHVPLLHISEENTERCYYI